MPGTCPVYYAIVLRWVVHEYTIELLKTGVTD